MAIELSTAKLSDQVINGTFYQWDALFTKSTMLAPLIKLQIITTPFYNNLNEAKIGASYLQEQSHPIYLTTTAHLLSLVMESPLNKYPNIVLVRAAHISWSKTAKFCCQARKPCHSLSSIAQTFLPFFTVQRLH
jgi:hypothetical protein